MDKSPLLSDETEILYLASLAPSGHNTQPWFVRLIEPFHWIIGNDKNKWLPAVDPLQRETILSIGTFLQNLEYAANNMGYNCQSNILATTCQDENVTELQLIKSTSTPTFDTQKIKQRRTVRSNYSNEPLKKEDLTYLMNEDADFFHFIPNTAKEYDWICEQTIEANKVQTYRDDAQKELANWIRFSHKEAEQYQDGLTTASMEVGGISGWVLRNFYGKSSVMKKNFREATIDKVKKQVTQSAGWILITSENNSVKALLETGKRMQRLFLKVKERKIAIHPMTQILEEAPINKLLNQVVNISDPIQFILRIGYLTDYPEPVSLRRPVKRFIRT